MIIRSGLRPDGRSLLAMPSETFARLTDEDTGRIIAFLRSLPLAPGPAASISAGPMGRIGLAIGQFKMAARLIAEANPPPEGAGPEAARGRYLALTVCSECHGSDLRGTSNPDFTSPDLRTVAAYQLEDFTRLLRTGIALGERTPANHGAVSATEPVASDGWRDRRPVCLSARRAGGQPAVARIPVGLGSCPHNSWPGAATSVECAPVKPNLTPSLVLCAVLAAAAMPLCAEDAAVSAQLERPAVRATAIEPGDAPQIDGDISDAIWSRAPRIDRFYQVEPVPMSAPSERTEAWILYDRNELYVAMHVHESDPGRVSVSTMERDGDMQADDVVRVMLDPRRTRREGYVFTLNMAGARWRRVADRRGAGQFRLKWNMLWRGKARRVADGWTAEFAVPFRGLSYDPASTQWGLDIVRQIRSPAKRSAGP